MQKTEEAQKMAVYTEKKTYHTKANMGMIDVTEDFQHAVTEACRQHGISAGIITGFTTGGVAGLTTLEFEPGIVNHDLKAALDVFSPSRDEKGRVVPSRLNAFVFDQFQAGYYAIGEKVGRAWHTGAELAK